MKYKDLENMVESVMLEESNISKRSKLHSERQEHGFIKAIRDAIEENDGKPIHVQFENGYYMPNVLGAQKVVGRAEDGYESYTDVEIQTKNHGTYNISMKGRDAPSIAPGGERIDTIYPRFLLAATKAATAALKKAGYNDGDWWIDNQKSMKGLVRSLLKNTFNPKSKFFGKQIIFVTTDGDKENLYYINKFDKKEDIPGPNEPAKAFGELPPYMGGQNMIEKISGDSVMIYADDDTDIVPSVPDVYIPLSEECVETLIRGNEMMGGPVDYVYVGDMEVRPKPLKKRKGRTSVLFVNAVLKDPDTDFRGQKAYLRIRKRRADMPFNSQKIVYDKNEEEYRYIVFDNGVYSGESSRVVIATKLPKNPFILEDEIDCCQIDGGCPGEVNSPPLFKDQPLKEDLTPNEKSYIMIENLVKEIMGVE